MLLLEQLQVCIFAKIVFGVRCILNLSSAGYVHNHRVKIIIKMKKKMFQLVKD